MKAVTAFDLLLKCAVALRADGAYVAEKNAALSAVIDVLSSEIRRILTPDDDEAASKETA